MGESKPFGDLNKAKVLVIGHDPRLQKSDTIADYCFFADYFFHPCPTKPQDKAKFEFASALFNYLFFITSKKYEATDFYITNLCNKELNHSKKGKTVLIPDEIAVEGIAQIRNILDNGQIELIIALSQQVNYLLQKHHFYYSNNFEYMKRSQPKESGIQNGYYEPKGRSPFSLICGEMYYVDEIPLFPLLHVKQYPLKGNVKLTYEDKVYESIRKIREFGSK